MAPREPEPRLPPGDEPFLVVGLARSGLAAARALVEMGFEVRGVDSGHPEGAEGLIAAGVEVGLDGDGIEQLEGAGTVIKSPGVPQDAAVIAAAREAQIPVLGELELAWRLIPNQVIAVTGTNGKTTVSEWLGHVWRTAGLRVEVAGNVGRPLSSLLGSTPPEATVICECSSFQLEDTIAFAPHIAVLLNVSPDHLDRHETLERYRAAKMQVFESQTETDFAVFDADLARFAASSRPGHGAAVAYGVSACTDGGCLVRLRETTIEADGTPLIAVEDLALPGAHNVRNAMAVAAVSISAGIDREPLATALADFGGVPHRLERIAEIEGVTYVNDSKATNVAAAAAALEAYGSGVHVILGGSLKGGGFEGLAAPVEAHAAAAYLIGEAAPTLAEALAGGSVPLVQCGDLAAAVAAASSAARAGETVLLAPGCASFDAFRDFEHRGRSFRKLVEGLR